MYFEPRLIKVGLAENVTEETLDTAADEVTVGLNDTERARIEASVAVVNAVYGAPQHEGKIKVVCSGTASDMPSKYRRFSGQLSRAWALCSGSETLSSMRPEIQLYEEIRVWMEKYDAAERQARGEPVPEEIQRLLGQLIAGATSSGQVLDIYDAQAVG